MGIALHRCQFTIWLDSLFPLNFFCFRFCLFRLAAHCKWQKPNDKFDKKKLQSIREKLIKLLFIHLFHLIGCYFHLFLHLLHRFNEAPGKSFFPIRCCWNWQYFITCFFKLLMNPHCDAKGHKKRNEGKTNKLHRSSRVRRICFTVIYVSKLDYGISVVN